MSPGTNRAGRPLAASSDMRLGPNPVCLSPAGHPATGANNRANQRNNYGAPRTTLLANARYQMTRTNAALGLTNRSSVPRKSPKMAASEATIALPRRSPGAKSSAFVVGLGCPSRSISRIHAAGDATTTVKSALRRSVSPADAGPSAADNRKTVTFSCSSVSAVDGMFDDVKRSADAIKPSASLRSIRSEAAAGPRSERTDPASEPISSKKAMAMRKRFTPPPKAKSHTAVFPRPKIRPKKAAGFLNKNQMANPAMMNEGKKRKCRSPLTIRSKRSPEPKAVQKRTRGRGSSLLRGMAYDVKSGAHGDAPYTAARNWHEGKPAASRLHAQVEAYRATLEEAEANYVTAKMAVQIKFQELHSALQAQEEALLMEDEAVIVHCNRRSKVIYRREDPDDVEEYQECCDEERILVLHDRECDPMPIDIQEQACQTSGLWDLDEHALEDTNSLLLVTIQEMKQSHETEVDGLRKEKAKLQEALDAKQKDHQQEHESKLKLMKQAHDEEMANLKQIIAALKAEELARNQKEAILLQHAQEAKQHHKAEKAEWEAEVTQLQATLESQTQKQKEREATLLDTIDGLKLTYEMEKSEWVRMNSLLKDTIAVKDHEHLRKVERLIKTIQEIKRFYNEEKIEWERQTNLLKEGLRVKDRENQQDKEKLLQAIDEIKLAHVREKADWEIKVASQLKGTLKAEESENQHEREQLLRNMREMKLAYTKEKNEWEGMKCLFRDTMAYKERDHQQEKEKFIKAMETMKHGLTREKADTEKWNSILKEALTTKEKEKHLEEEKFFKTLREMSQSHANETAELRRMNTDLRNALTAQDKQHQLKQQTLTETIQAAKEAMDSEKAEWEQQYSTVQTALAAVEKLNQQKDTKLLEMAKDLETARQVNRELLTKCHELEDQKAYDLAQLGEEASQHLKEEIASPATACKTQNTIGTQTTNLIEAAVCGTCCIGVQAHFCSAVHATAGVQTSMDNLQGCHTSTQTNSSSADEMTVREAPEKATQVFLSTLERATQTEDCIEEPEPAAVEGSSVPEPTQEPSASPLETPHNDSCYFDYVMSHWADTGVPHFPGPGDTPSPGPAFLSLTGAIPSHIMPLLEAMASNAIFIQPTSLPQQRTAFIQSAHGDEFHFATAATSELAAALEVLAVNTGNPVLEEDFDAEAWPNAFMCLMNELRSRLTQICLQRENEKQEFEEQLDMAVQEHAQFMCTIEDQNSYNLEKIFITAERAKKACEDFRSAVFAQFNNFLRKIQSSLGGKSEGEINYKELFMQAKDWMEQFASGFAPAAGQEKSPAVPDGRSGRSTCTALAVMQHFQTTAQADTNIAATIISQAKTGALECCVTGVVGDLGLQALETIVSNHDAALHGMRQSLAQIHNIQRQLKDTFCTIKTRAILLSRNSGDGGHRLTFDFQQPQVLHSSTYQRRGVEITESFLSSSTTGPDTNDDSRSTCSSSCCTSAGAADSKRLSSKEKELIKLRECLRKRTEEKAGLNREIQSLRDSRKAAMAKLDKLIGENRELAGKLSYMESIFCQQMQPVNHHHHQPHPHHNNPTLPAPMRGAMGPNNHR